MCGRYSVFDEEEILEIREIIREVNKVFGRDGKVKTGEIFPTDKAPILTLGEAGIRALPMMWGFPGFSGRGIIINAKAETASEKNMFRSSLLSRRCVVPSTGFYEWQKIPGKKQKDKYLIRFGDTPVLYMAGIYNTFQKPDGSKSAGFVILTTAASDGVSAIHDRMPVILAPGEKELWIGDFGSVDRILKRAGPSLVLNKVS